LKNEETTIGQVKVSESSEELLKGVLIEYFRRDPIGMYQDMKSEGHDLPLRSLEGIAKRGLGLLSEETRAKLKFIDIAGLAKHNKLLYSEFCDAVLSTAGKLKDFVIQGKGYKSVAAIKVIAYHLLQNFQSVMPHFKKMNIENQDKYQGCLITLDRLQSETEQYVGENWKIIENKRTPGIDRIPKYLAPHKLCVNITEENISKFLGPVDSSAKKLCLDYYPNFKEQYLKK